MAGLAVRAGDRDRGLIGMPGLPANLTEAFLYRAELNAAKLNRAKLNQAQLNQAQLNAAVDLSGAELNKVTLNQAELNNASLRGAKLSGANLYGAEMNSERQRTSADQSGRRLGGLPPPNFVVQPFDLFGKNLQKATLRPPLVYRESDALDKWGEHVEKLVAPRLPGLL